MQPDNAAVGGGGLRAGGVARTIHDHVAAHGATAIERYVDAFASSAPPSLRQLAEIAPHMGLIHMKNVGLACVCQITRHN